MVLHAASEVLQLFVSLPLTPLTYHMVLANADVDSAKISAKGSVLLIVSLRFITFLPLASGNPWEADACASKSPLPRAIAS
jgi:hypothetical protein